MVLINIEVDRMWTRINKFVEGRNCYVTSSVGLKSEMYWLA